MGSKPLKRRRVYTHNTLFCCAEYFLAQSKENAEPENCMACVLFCAMALEASLNHAGASLFQVWADVEKGLRPRAKLKMIAERAGNLPTVDFSKRPSQSFDVLFRIRNTLAHGRVEELEYSESKRWIAVEDQKWAATDWEAVCCTERASVLLEDTAALMTFLNEMDGVDKVPSFLLSEHV